jgi:hypothetical protein
MNKMLNIAAWTNRGENTFPDSMRLAGWQREQEDKYLEKATSNLTKWSDGKDIDALIQFAGEQYEKQNPPKVSVDPVEVKPTKPAKQVYKPKTPLPTIPEDWADDWRSKQPAVRDKTTFESQFHELSTFMGGPLDGHKITMDSFLNAIQRPEFSALHMGESTLQHVLDNFVNQRYSWTKGQDTTLHAGNIPNITGHETQFQGLLEHLDQQGADVKQRAAYLHDVVYEPQAEKYMQMYHPNEQVNIGHDAENHIELFDDWEINKSHQNIVKVGDKEYHQMDFGYTEDV